MPHRPGHQETSFFNTLSELGKQRAGIPRRLREPRRRPRALQPPIMQPPFAETMGQTPFSGPQRDAVSDARTAIGYDPSLSQGMALANALGLNQISPAGQANLATNVAQNYPIAPPVSIPTSAPGTPMANSDSVSASLQVAPMLDVFRNNPTAMQALSGVYGEGLPGYIPQSFGFSQNIFPWEQFSPIMGSMPNQWGRGPNTGRGMWAPGISPRTPTGAPSWMTDPYGSQFGNRLNQRYPGMGFSGIGGPPRRGGL